MILSYDVGVERLASWCVCHAISKLTQAAHHSSSISFLFALGVQAKTELNCEPVNCRQPLQLDLAAAERGQSNFLTKLGELGVSKHRGVTDQLVDDVRLRSVLWRSMMSDILSAMEDLESQSIQELTLG